MPTIDYTETLTTVTCVCGMNYAIPVALNQQMLDDRGPSGKWAYCPAGHRWHYAGKSDADKAREQRDRAEARLRAKDDQLKATERSLSATKGQLTKARKRADRGVCQHCNRSFVNVTRHVESQHPEALAH